MYQAVMDLLGTYDLLLSRLTCLIACYTDWCTINSQKNRSSWSFDLGAEIVDQSVPPAN